MSVHMHSYFKNLLVGYAMTVTEIKTKQNANVVPVQEDSWECRGVVQYVPNLGIRRRKASFTSVCCKFGHDLRLGTV
jgi:hypothetical protein